MGFKSFKSIGSQNFQNAGFRISAFTGSTVVPIIQTLTSDQLATLASSTQAQIAALTTDQIGALIAPGLIINTLATGATSVNCQRYDSNGNLYIGGIGIIQTYINNVLTTIAGSGSSGFSGDGQLATSALIGTVRGINFDSVGNIYFADYTYHVIRKINISNGFITTIAGTGGSVGNSGSGGSAATALLNNPHDLVFDSTGNMFISCRGSSVINKIAPNGIITTIAGTGTGGYSGDGASATLANISGPCQLFLNQTTMCLYFADGGNNRIRKIDLNSGIITTVAGSGSSTSSGDGGAAILAGFYLIRGLTFDLAGNMYISESLKVRKVNTSGIVSTYAGTGVSGNTGSGGFATLATFGQAFYLCFDPLGYLVICDVGNYNIRKLSSGGYINPLSITQIPYLTIAQIPYLTMTYLLVSQIQALTPTQIQALTPTQILALTSTQISGLTPMQLSVLNPTLLSPTQISALSAFQYSVINNGVINSTTYTSPFQPYLNSSTFSLNAGTYYMLVVGGGGGGGVDRTPTSGGSVTGGGGGAGGVLQKTVVLTNTNIITIVIGNGGDRSTQTSPASNGGNTTVSFSVDTGNNIIATGGGYGGGISGYSIGGNGGSGGGGGGTDPASASGTGISGQGFNGGPSGEDRYSGKGGGGAGGNTSNSIGGIGVKCSLPTISSNYPSTYYWGGGGGGGGGGTSQAGGYGGGGNGGGGVNTLNPSSSALNVGGSGYNSNDPAGYGGGGNGGNNTGGGGGGAGRATIPTTLGGYGGSGIVVIGQ